MKRTSREWLYSLHWGLTDKHAQDILDSDARQRAVIRDLKARVKQLEAVTSPYSAAATRGPADEE
jgi:hypothetical protein